MSDVPSQPKSSGTRSVAVLVLGILLGGAAMFGVTRAGHRHEGEPSSDAATAQPKYHCPMHPTYVSDKPGECPICGMKLTLIEQDKQDAHKPAEGGPRKIAFYRSPMNPSQTSAVPRKDEMGMEFVAVYQDELGGTNPVDGLATVQIDGERQQLIGMRLAKASVGPVGTGWRTVGRVAVDETRVHKINVKVDGFVEKLFADFIGKPVQKGAPLLTLYSPALLAVQDEYLLARDTQRKLSATGQASVAEDLVASARRRLELWDIPPAEIDELDRSGKARRTLTLPSPVSGTITAKTVVQGSRLAAGDTPFEITDLSQVWVLADAYESDFKRLKLGLPAEFRLAAIEGKVFRGQVTFIEPVIDPKTRTARMRLTFANPRGELRPEMFGEVSFQAKSRDVLRVPFDAVIDSGEQTVVFVAVGDGKFQPRLVKIGAQSADFVEILSGLNTGEQVVTRANFLIDSESRLKAALAAVVEKPAARDGGTAKGPKP